MFGKGHHVSKAKHRRVWRATRLGMALALFVVVAHEPAAGASDPVSPDDLRAAVRTLGFLEAPQLGKTVSIGVVYRGSVHDDQGLATRIAAQLAAMPGPNSSTIRANPSPSKSLRKVRNTITPSI